MRIAIYKPQDNRIYEEDNGMYELARYNVLQADSDPIFDDIAILAAQVCGTPAAMICFLTDEHCYVKSRYNTNIKPGAKGVEFCSYVVATKMTLIVNDTTQDLRFIESTSESSEEIGFYAGAPLISARGHALGSLCAIDTKPNRLDTKQKRGLEALAQHVVRCMELRIGSSPLGEAKSFVADLEADRQAAIMKSQFLAHMSHEIRTPIHGITGCIELLQSSPLTEEQRQLLEIMQESSERISRLTNDMLDIAKIETEELALEFIRFQPIKIFESVHRKTRLSASRKSLELNFTVPPSMTQVVVGDAVRFEEIIRNIVDNAIEYTEQGAISVTVENWSNDNCELLLFIQISDTGSGIAPERVDNLFESVGQVGESHTWKHGLGLSLTKFLVEKMQGTIGVTSEVGIGTLFWIKMRFDVQQALERPPAFKGLTALIVDDNAINQTVLRRQITDHFISITSVVDGSQAVEVCKRIKFSVIFMDCQMPVMDGYEATTEIRKFDRQTPIIAVSANTIKTDIERCFEVGMNAYLSKPVNRMVILECVTACLR
ncbi:hypothetical protein K493DRAFT_337790 [Basidiobolus meristosporus CBS 931.73]|uniref:Uncharacterized sensor-like histidine kinase ycf26 n=1 Tax=Basidiobolus meristosporus CBS 931.73 TaxID=1314790 RepID=A0A1Y1Y951_9FUNG|nr:hypothetical protein K493DRAFT_337790 [Basidiobolus meristosporus CBS 931.73]|eukprot:ORX94513.1 hypothetical protein K493DRAFT_337790 [Basidiobolus meristosporus CBS 931.73]